MSKKIILVFLLLFGGISLLAQAPEKKKKKIDGQVVRTVIDECDTLLLADLENVTVTSFRKFESDEDYKKYLRYRRYAAKVYPFAVESIKLYRDLKEESKDWKKRKKRKQARKLNKDLSDEYKETLKNLTKTQGYILVKMIERELDIPFFFLIKDLRGGFNATYWSSLGALYGYKLDDGYIIGEDPILDAVLQDFNISHEPQK